MKKLRVLKTLKGSRIFDVGETFPEGSKEFAELEAETGLVEIISPKPAPVVAAEEPAETAEPEEKATARKRR